jgi:hypothetical protein
MAATLDLEGAMADDVGLPVARQPPRSQDTLVHGPVERVEISSTQTETFVADDPVLDAVIISQEITGGPFASVARQDNICTSDRSLHCMRSYARTSALQTNVKILGSTGLDVSMESQEGLGPRKKKKKKRKRDEIDDIFGVLIAKVEP